MEKIYIHKDVREYYDFLKSLSTKKARKLSLVFIDKEIVEQIETSIIPIHAVQQDKKHLYQIVDSQSGEIIVEGLHAKQVVMLYRLNPIQLRIKGFEVIPFDILLTALFKDLDYVEETELDNTLVNMLYTWATDVLNITDPTLLDIERVFKNHVANQAQVRKDLQKQAVIEFTKQLRSKH